MKKHLTLLSLLLASSFISAQTVIFTDDFESYNTTESIPSQTTNWQTWSGGTTGSEASFVSAEQTYSGIKSMKVVENNDMVYDFGGVSTGLWRISFWMYIEAGKTGYFNVEHVFGSKWAFECYFENGILTLKNGETSTFSYPTDTWINILLDIDLDSDEATLNLNDVELISWPYSNLASGGTWATPKLDIINFYAGTGFEFFVDDFSFANTVPFVIIPTIVIETTPIFKCMNYWPPSLELPFSNVGTMDMEYSVYVKFDDPSVSSTLVAGKMKYDGDNASAIGWQESYELYAAVRFQNDQTSMHVGQEIESVDIFINDLPIGDITVYVWNKGSFVDPGATTILSEKTFTPVAHSWNTITLNNPVQIIGEEIWVGYKFTTPAGGNTLGIDGETVTPATNYLKSGIAWGEFYGVGQTGIGNFSIRANVAGAGWPTWLSVTPQAGIVEGDESQVLTLNFNPEELNYYTCYATIVVGCNDYSQNWTEIPVTYEFCVGIDNTTKIGVITYPNPATQNINVVSDASISSISVYSISGHFIKSIQVNATTTKIDVANMPSGMYVMEVNFGNDVVKSKFVVK
jgi:hypothetical protein